MGSIFPSKKTKKEETNKNITNKNCNGQQQMNGNGYQAEYGNKPTFCYQSSNGYQNCYNKHTTKVSEFYECWKQQASYGQQQISLRQKTDTKNSIIKKLDKICNNNQIIIEQINSEMNKLYDENKYSYDLETFKGKMGKDKLSMCLREYIDKDKTIEYYYKFKYFEILEKFIRSKYDNLENKYNNLIDEKINLKNDNKNLADKKIELENEKIKLEEEKNQLENSFADLGDEINDLEI